MTVETRFLLPDGFHRTAEDTGSFGTYLRRLPLKPEGTPARYYNGDEKRAEGVYVAVIDMEIGRSDLQQCADAVMRLRGEWLYSRGAYDRIQFNFLSDGQPRKFIDFKDGDVTRPVFRQYMDYVFTCANTASLHDEMVPVAPFEDIRVGDVLIVKGHPWGHAVIVVDLAEHEQSGRKICLLAQSYMPAQDIQILVNIHDPDLSPWYHVRTGLIRTPEWTFESGDLRRFPEE